MQKQAQTSVPIHWPIANRWSPRAFGTAPVSAVDLTKILEAARWAPSCFNEQPWAFLVATKDQPEEFQKALSCLVEFNQGWAKNAHVLIFGLAHKVSNHNGKPNPYAWHDLGLATSQLILEGESLGLRTHAMAGIQADRVREVFGVPDDFEPVTALAIGRPGDPENLPEPLLVKEKAPRERKSLDQIAFGGQFGKPFADKGH